jgi:hypothetical protein
MNTQADKTPENKSQSLANGHALHQNSDEGTFQFVDKRPEALAQRKLQEIANNSSKIRQLKATQDNINNSIQAKQIHQLQQKVVQLASKKGPDGSNIEVAEVDNYLPNFIDNGDLSRKMYRRNAGITEGWNDTDLFYADGEGDLVQMTIKMVNDYWDPKYEGFAQLSGPDWTKNCEEYAVADGAGTKSGEYKNKGELTALLPDVGNYVINMYHHWMRVEKTGADTITIRQKDGESAVYTKNFNLNAACEYIIGKGGTGSVYKL